MEKEIWKDVPNYDGDYQVSNLGNVRSFKYLKEGKLMKSILDEKGYLRLGLTKNNKHTKFRIHKLVAMAFLNHIPCGMKWVVNHINLIKTDNRVENLEIVTNRVNGNKKHLKSTSKYTGVWRNKSSKKSSKKWSAGINIMGKNIKLGTFTSELEASKAYQSKLKEVLKEENMVYNKEKPSGS